MTVEEQVDLLHFFRRGKVVDNRVGALHRLDRADHLVHRGWAVHPTPGICEEISTLPWEAAHKGLKTSLAPGPSHPSGHGDDPVRIRGEQLLGFYVAPARGLRSRSVDVCGTNDIDHLNLDGLAPRGAQARITCAVVDEDTLLVSDRRRSSRTRWRFHPRRG